jgi:hypothetical protein
MSDLETNGWTPILSADGVYYCSPRCGGGKHCRKEDYDAATKAADELAARMGDGWKAYVWENLGWHYNVSKGSATVKPSIYRGHVDSYSAWIEPKIKSPFGKSMTTAIQIIEDAATPEDALGFAVQKARTFMARMNDALSELNEEIATY